MSAEEIKDKEGHIIGYLETKENGDQILTNAVRKLKGYYDAQTDHTRDEHRNIVAKGNKLRAMIC
jgi:hypothetical protein